MTETETPIEQPVMSEQQIADERRRGRFAGIAAFATVALIAAGGFWASKIDEVDRLAALDTQSGKLIGSSVIEALGLLLLMVPALHLYRATKARRPETTNLLGYAAAVGPITLCVTNVIRPFVVVHAASIFV